MLRRKKIYKEIKNKKLTHDHLLSRLNYNSDTGIFTWKERQPSEFKPGNKSSEANCNSWNKKFAHKQAGSLSKASGYIEISIDKKHYLAHRIAWFHYYGYMPENQIDHKDRVRHHNWIDNLREASQQCQSRNSSIAKNNTSGVVGVSLLTWSKKHPNYKKQHVSQITVNKKNIYLGCFENFADAVKARWKAEVKYNFPNCNTSSTAYNYLKENGLI